MQGGDQESDAELVPELMRETPHSAPPALECGAPTQLERDKETCRTLAEKLDTPRRHQSVPHETENQARAKTLDPPFSPNTTRRK